MNKSKEALPLPLSSSFSSLVSQATLTDSQDVIEKYEKQQQHQPVPQQQNFSFNHHDLDESTSQSALPLSVDLTSMWHVQTPPILTSANHQNYANASSRTSFTTLCHKISHDDSVSYFNPVPPLPSNDTILSEEPTHHLHHRKPASPSHYDIIPMPRYESLSRHSSAHTHRATSVYHGTPSTTIEPSPPNTATITMTADDCQKLPSSFHEMKKKIICVLGQSLISGGCPVYRADEVLRHCSKLLDMDISFTFLPDSIMVTFINEEEEAQSMMVKACPSYDTGKLGRINHIMNQFLFKYHRQQQASAPDEPILGFSPLDHCLQSLYTVMDSPPTCGFLSTLIGFSLSAFSGCILLFKGSWVDAGLSGLLGALVGLLSILSSRYPIYGRVFELSSSVIVAIIARALYQYCCFSSVGVSAILILLPGYTMTIAVMELSARHINTGTIRLVYAVVYAFVLAYGLQVGSSMYSVMDPQASDEGLCENAVSPWFYIPLFPVLTISIAMTFGSTRKQWLTQTLCGAVGYAPSFFLAQVIPDGQIIGSIAALAVGLYANFALKITGEAPLVPLCVGVTLLVPGSIGVRGAYTLLHQEDMSHDSFPIQMLTICLGIVAGLFAAAMIVYPSGKQRSLYVSL